jgi:hypothetical protein
MKCPICGANIEVTEFEDGSVLIRRDCMCDLSEHSTTDVVKSSQLGFEVPEVGEQGEAA